MGSWETKCTVENPYLNQKLKISGLWDITYASAMKNSKL